MAKSTQNIDIAQKHQWKSFRYICQKYGLVLGRFKLWVLMRSLLLN